VLFYPLSFNFAYILPFPAFFFYISALFLFSPWMSKGGGGGISNNERITAIAVFFGGGGGKKKRKGNMKVKGKMYANIGKKA
jgi:hypothetical protein